MKGISLVLIAILQALSDSSQSSMVQSSIRQSPQGPARDVGFDPRPGEQVPLDLTFLDEAGRTVRFGEVAGRSPVVLALVYHRCPMLCTQVLSGLVHGLKGVTLNPGKHFRVVAVSIDPADTPELAAGRKRECLERYGRPGTESGWTFLTGTEPAIRDLARSVGFRYRYEPRTGQYAHASGIVILTPQGRVSRAIYGIAYPPRDLRLGLVEASAGTLGTSADKLLLLCYRYDPESGRYGPAIMNIVRLSGAATVLALGMTIFLLARRGRRRHG